MSKWNDFDQNQRWPLSHLINIQRHVSTRHCLVIQCNPYTVQLRYLRTTHTRIIRAYFAYTRMSIRAHIHMYTRTYTYIRIRTHVYVHVYVSLLCIPISFFMWSIVGQTKGIVFLGMKKASKRNLHVVRTSCWSMKTIIFQVFDYFANSPTNYCLLTLAWS